MSENDKPEQEPTPWQQPHPPAGPAANPGSFDAPAQPGPSSALPNPSSGAPANPGSFGAPANPGPYGAPANQGFGGSPHQSYGGPPQPGPGGPPNPNFGGPPQPVSGGSAQPGYGGPAHQSFGGPPHYGSYGAPATPGEAPGEPVAPTTAMPAQGQHPHWMPPPRRPKKVPTAVKVLLGGVAAVALALCSGVTGAVVATVIADRGGIEIPTSTDAAPVINPTALSGVAAKTMPNVVSIATGQGEGSGVILTKDGYILTNNHVVESASGDRVTVTLSDGKKVTASVVGTDARTDLAVIKAEATDLKPATFADSNRVAVGDTVLAIGSPLGLEGSVTSGIISAKDRTIQAGRGDTSLSGLLQTDAPINPGNSGGALVNTNGDVIGINTAIATSDGGQGNIGLGFAIPSNKAKQVAEQLINGEKVSHAYLGVQVTAEETGGARVGVVQPDSPAAAAGLQKDDIIRKFGDRVINDSDDLVSAVQASTVGQKVTVEFIRNGQPQTATVTLGEAS